MKLVTAIVSKEDSKAVNAELVAAGYSVTRLSTTGGFLLANNITMLIVVEDEKVQDCIGIISLHSRQRKELVPSTPSYGVAITAAFPLEVVVGGATVYVTNVERFEKL